MIASLLAAVSWLSAAALAALPAATPRNRRPTWPEACFASAFGASALGVAWLLLRLWGPGPNARFAVGAALLAVAGFNVMKRGRLVVPVAPSCNAATWIAALFAVCWLSPVAVSGLRMGSGAYPAMFFHIDTPYRLTHVRVLERPGGLPPPSLSNNGIAAAYHYGAPAVAAGLAGLSGLPAHTSLFAVVQPLAAAGILCVSWLLATAVATRGSTIHLLLFMFLTVAWSAQFAYADLLVRAVTTLDGALLRSFAVRAWSNPETFANQAPDVTVLFGRLLFTVTLLPMVLPSRRTLYTAAIAVALLVQIRAGVALIAALTFAGTCACLALSQRERWPMLAGGAGAAASLLVAHATGWTTLYSLQLAFEPPWMLRYYPGLVARYLAAAALFAGLPCLLARLTAASLRRDGWANAVVPAALGSLLALGFFQLVGARAPSLVWDLRQSSELLPLDDWVEPLADTASIFAMIGAIALGRAWIVLDRRRRRAIVALLVGIVALPLVHRLNGARLMAFDPVRAHEYVDNRPMAAALVHIPLAGAVVATNDLHYPTVGEERDLRQYQISAIWGHQSFAAPGYERYPGWRERVLLQQALAANVPCPVLMQLAAAGATHLLIHKQGDYPRVLPLPVLYEDGRFAVYALSGATLPC